MPVPLDVDEPERPTLRVLYETRTAIGAVEFGALIEELGKGFDRHARKNRLRGLRLVVVGAGLGSHWFEMAVVGTSVASGLGAVVTYRKEIYDFADFISKLFDMAKTKTREQTKAGDRRLVDSACAPVISGQATQINITVLGGAPVITINQSTAGSLLSTDPGGEGDPSIIGRRSHKNAITEPNDPAPAIRRLEGHFGTIFDVKGEWYVRLEGHEGVMNPVSVAAGVSVGDGQAYVLNGTWEGRRYWIAAAEPLPFK